MVGNRTGRVRHYFWVFPAGLLGEHAQRIPPRCWFHCLNMFLAFFPEFLFPRTPLPGPALLKLCPDSSAPHPVEGSCLESHPKIWLEEEVSYAFLPKAISPAVDP